jgi:hypothetical protein
MYLANQNNLADYFTRNISVVHSSTFFLATTSTKEATLRNCTIEQAVLAQQHPRFKALRIRCETPTTHFCIKFPVERRLCVKMRPKSNPNHRLQEPLFDPAVPNIPFSQEIAAPRGWHCASAEGQGY